MAPVELPDPSMHTIYVVDPAQMFTRYAAAFASTARMREGAQAGFLVLARLSYLAFGILPGFFVTRYVLALVAVVPAYVLLRRLYGPWAGVLAVIVILSSPVVLTAWGTDYPDCAVVSYVTGALCCLAMPSSRHKRAFLAAGGVLLCLGIFSHGMGIVLAVTTLFVYGIVCLVRSPGRFLGDVLVIGASVLVTTFLLMLASWAVLGQFNFITPTIAAARYLNRPDQIVQWHSANWRWAPYVAYLLVPPAVIVSYLVVFLRRLGRLATPQLFVGLCCAAQLAVFSYLQFGYHVQTLEMHFFSSTIYGALAVCLSICLAEMARPISSHRIWRWLPAVAVLAVPLAYEADPNVPPFGWWPTGAVLAAVPVLVALVMRLWSSRPSASSVTRVGVVAAVALAVVAMTGALLELTVAPRPTTPKLTGIALAGDPVSNYAGALGGNASQLIDWYVVSAELPGFVGDPTYKGEQLLTWTPTALGNLVEPFGIFHAGFNWLEGLPVLSPADYVKLALRRPAEVLLLNTTGAGFGAALAELEPYRPTVVRTGVLSDGTAVLHARLLVLDVYARAGTRVA